MLLYSEVWCIRNGSHCHRVVVASLCFLVCCCRRLLLSLFSFFCVPSCRRLLTLFSCFLLSSSYMPLSFLPSCRHPYIARYVSCWLSYVVLSFASCVAYAICLTRCSCSVDCCLVSCSQSCVCIFLVLISTSCLTFRSVVGFFCGRRSYSLFESLSFALPSLLFVPIPIAVLALVCHRAWIALTAPLALFNCSLHHRRPSRLPTFCACY